MADNSSSGSKSGKTKAPNFYEAAASMPGAAGGGAGGDKGGSAASMSEKVSNVQALLEVFKKMDKLETDPDAKGMIQKMSDLAQEYINKIQKPATGAAPATGAGASPPPPPATPDMGATPPAVGGSMGMGGAAA
jgi:hypothetical protein